MSNNNEIAASTKQQLMVIGGGAAGFFCAINAARLNPELKVIILEKSGKLLSKVRISGGGRCNVTHACFDIPELVTKYPRGKNFVKKTLHWFNPVHTIQWFEKRGVALKTESDGRMFPATNTSQTIIDCLVSEANKYGVEILLNADVIKIEHSINGFNLHTATNKNFFTDYLCVSCGGFPKTSHFNWLTALGHTIQEPVPSLFTFNIPDNPITSLMGVSVEQAAVKIIGSKLQNEGPLLITHWGLSGPAVLKLSAFAARELAERKYDFSILVNWLPQYNEQTLKEKWLQLRNSLSAQKVSNKNPFGLPNRLWLHLLQIAGVHEEIRWAEITSKQQNQLINNLVAQSFAVKGKTTFKEEFVTAGGINLAEIDASTMESKIIRDLFFAGEIIDVDGITGGFNFQHAWTSGFIAANAIAQMSKHKKTEL